MVLNNGRGFLHLTRPLTQLGSDGSTYKRLQVEEEPLRLPPKGHVVVYVEGETEGERRRVFLPVVYINHPLFSELLGEAEEDGRLRRDGGISLPCTASALQHVSSKIAAVSSRRGTSRLRFWTFADLRSLVEERC